MRLASIAIYPVKGCRRTELERAAIGRFGLAHDRAWMVVRPDGFFLTQRSHPGLARIVPRLAEASLVLEHEGRAPVEVDPRAATRPIDITVWGRKATARDAGDAPAAWLSAVLGEPVRLAALGPETRMHADRKFVGERDVPVSFADGYPVLICNRASLEELNRRVGVELPMNRFRPNLVVEGLGAFGEDGIRSLRIGAVTFSLVKPCARCIVPSLDQQTGAKSTDPTPALKAFRWDKQLRGVTFGVNAVPEGGEGAALAVGDPVEVLG